MDDQHLLTIGAPAARTGLSVKRIRFYSDKASRRARNRPAAPFPDLEPVFTWFDQALRTRPDSRP